jgi:hypothetical protein
MYGCNDVTDQGDTSWTVAVRNFLCGVLAFAYKRKSGLFWYRFEGYSG